MCQYDPQCPVGKHRPGTVCPRSGRGGHQEARPEDSWSAAKPPATWTMPISGDNTAWGGEGAGSPAPLTGSAATGSDRGEGTSTAQQPQAAAWAASPLDGSEPATSQPDETGSQLSKKEGCLGCGCLTLILLFLIGACGAIFGDDEDGDSNITPTSTSSRTTTTPTVTVTPSPSTTATSEPEPSETSTRTSTPAATPTTSRSTTPRPTRTSTPPPQPTSEPEPEPTSEPESEPEQPPAEVFYDNCTEVKEAGAAPIYAGQPGFGSHLDRDGDGVACET